MFFPFFGAGQSVLEVGDDLYRLPHPGAQFSRSLTFQHGLFDLIKAVQPYSANRPYKCVSDLVAIPILMIRLSRDDFMVSSARIPL